MLVRIRSGKGGKRRGSYVNEAFLKTELHFDSVQCFVVYVEPTIIIQISLKLKPN